MKKTIKLPDGTEEVYEGTPEELAELEKKLREGTPREQSGKKRVLNEERSAFHDCCRHGGSCKNIGCCEHKELLKAAVREVLNERGLWWPAYQPIWITADPVVYDPMKVEPTWVGDPLPGQETTTISSTTQYKYPPAESSESFVAGGVCGQKTNVFFRS